MSITFEIDDDDKNLPEILARYDKYLVDATTHLELKGKTLSNANLEHATWMAYYDEKRIELHSLVKHYENKLAKIKGNLWVNFTEKHSVSLQSTDKTHYILREPRYLEVNQLYLLTNEVYLKYDSLVEAFKARGFALRNITNLRVAAVEDNIL